MIQDLAPKKYHVEYKNKQPGEEDTVLVYKGRKILIDLSDKGNIVYPKRKEFIGFELQYTYLFSIDEEEFYLGVSESDGFPGGYTFEDVFELRLTAPKHLSYAGVTGYQLSEWYESHRYCGHCAVETRKDDKERMLRCPKCGRMFFPQICPGVIVAVTHKGRLLMSKYAGRGYTSFALIAGFNETGETIEETVHREVMEEVGLPVKNLVYYKSQPWTFTDVLLMGFFCELDGDCESITLDRNELAEAGFYTPEEIPEDDGVSLTREMMTCFKNGNYPNKYEGD